MSSWTIIYSSDHKGNFIHEEYLRKSNPDAQILKLDMTNDLPEDIGWKQSDIIVREWMKQNHNEIEHNNVALIEYDVLVNMKLPNIYLDNTIMGKQPLNLVDNPSWWPFTEKHRLGYLEKDAYGLWFFGFYMMSRNCIEYLIKAEYDFLFNYEVDILSELKFITILKHNNVSIEAANPLYMCNFLCGKRGNGSIPDIDYRLSIPGIYHPVKNRVAI